jgi:hypothetical protein
LTCQKILTSQNIETERVEMNLINRTKSEAWWYVNPQEEGVLPSGILMPGDKVYLAFQGGGPYTVGFAPGSDCDGSFTADVVDAGATVIIALQVSSGEE